MMGKIRQWALPSSRPQELSVVVSHGKFLVLYSQERAL